MQVAICMCECPLKRCQLDSFMHVFVPLDFHQSMHKSAFVLQQMWRMSCSLKTVYSETSSWEMHYTIISVTGTFTDTNYTSSIAVFSCGIWHTAFMLIASRTRDVTQTTSQVHLDLWLLDYDGKYYNQDYFAWFWDHCSITRFLINLGNKMNKWSKNKCFYLILD